MISLFCIQISVGDPDPHSAWISIIFGSRIQTLIRLKSWIRSGLKSKFKSFFLEAQQINIEQRMDVNPHSRGLEGL
jgi:hypothetical protein